MAGKKRVRREASGAGAAPSGAGGGGGLLERRGFWIAVGILAVLLAVFFYPLLFGGKAFLPPDQMASLAQKSFLDQAFSGPGSFLQKYPLWTPYMFSGMPSYASMIAAPYVNPTSLVLDFMPHALKLVFYYLLIGLFTWILLRRQGVGVLASVLGATAFIFCTHIITSIMFAHNTKIGTLVYLPLVILASRELWRSPRIFWASILALAVGNMLLSFHLQIAYYALLAGGFYMLVVTIRGIREHLGASGLARRWVLWGLAIAVGFGASAVLFLPVHDYAAYSIRGGTAGGLSFEYATNWSLHPLEMSTFFVPSFMGFGSSSYWGWMPFTDFPHYMGILVFFLAVLAAVLWPRERFHLYLILLAAVSLLLSFGKHLPALYEPMFKFFPYFNKFRVPSMILILFQFSVALLAASALDRILRAGKEEARRILRAVLWLGGAFLGVVVILGALVAGGGLNGTLMARLAARGPMLGLQANQVAAYVAREAPMVRSMVGTDTVVVALILAAGVALLWARLRGKLGPTAVALGILVLTVVDLWRVDVRPADYQPRSNLKTAFEPTPAVEFLKKDPEPYRILPLTGQGGTNNWYAYFRIPSILGYHPAKLQIYQDLIDDQGPVGISKQLSQGNFNIVDMLNMKYLVADRELEVGPLHTVFRGKPAVMENAGALPRMWFVDRTRVIEDPKRHLAALADPSWNPREEAFLFDSIPGLEPGSGGTASITELAPREIRATVTSPANALLVVSEVYYPAGWHATLDGKPVPIHRVNYVLRGIVVPPGEHTLLMRFDPKDFRDGILASLASYGLIVLGLAVSGLRRRRGSGAGEPAEARSEG